MGSKRKLASRRESFLKALDDDFSKKLTIPQAFIRNFNGDIPHWFFLEIAGTRKGWRVDIEEDGCGGFCFDCGWNEFKKDQSLQVGDFLLFEYEEPLILQVKIFEKNGTEKANGTNVELQCEVEGSECQKQSPKIIRDEEADFWSTRHSGHYEGHEMFQDITDKIEMETDDQDGIHEKHQDVMNKFEMETDYGYGLLEKQCKVNNMTVSETDDQCRVHETRLDDFERIERGTGKVFATKQGVCYMVTWRKASHLYYYLTIPRAIVNGKKISNDETVILKDQKGSTWPMKLRARPGGRVDLVQGWKEFLIENNVRDGDILTFEFVLDKVIQIHIERATRRICEINPPFGKDCSIDPPFERAWPISAPFERAYPLDPPYSANKREPMIPFDNICEDPDINGTISDHSVPETRGKTERICFDDFTNSSFTVTWKHSSRASYLHIPKAIAITQKLKNNDTVLLCDSDGTKWPVKIRTRPSDGRFGLSRGWSTFWRQCDIGFGDTLVFKFVSCHFLKVNIIKALVVQPSLSEGLFVKQEVMQLE